MSNRLASIISASLFLATLGILFFPKQEFAERFSPQGTAYPGEVVESFDSRATIAVYDNETVSIPSSINQLLATQPTSRNVLGAVSGQKRIEVDLAKQRLYAYEGANKIFDFLISSGKYGKTPVGTFQIWTKLRSTKMEGGKKELGTYYYLPNVPYVMFFYNKEIPQWRGFGIHGTYWHSNFGTPMSHGCINMKTEEVEQLFYWAQPDLQGKSSIKASDDNPGTPVVIYGQAP